MLRFIALLAVGASLVWLIVAHSFAAYFARTSPELALALNSDQPVALVKLANARLALLRPDTGSANGDSEADVDSSRLADFATRAPAADPVSEANGAGGENAATVDAASRAELRALAERTLAAHPLESAALFLLGQITEWEGDDARARGLMEAAARRSFRQTVAVYQLLLRSLDERDYADALDRADAIMRTAPNHTRHIVSLLAQAAKDDAARRLVGQRLTENPPWRSAFLSGMPQTVTDARAPLDILLMLKDSPAPPTSAELRGYLSFLIRHKFHELAYYTWLQFLTAEDLSSTGLLYNGRFERPLSGLPFDWVIRRGTGVIVRMSPAAGLERGRALVIELGHGRIEFGSVSQMTLLAPGTYRFTGRLIGELAGRRGLVWRVACAGERNQVLGASEMMVGLAPRWQTFGFTFEVPGDRQCRAQNVSLTLDARSASERLVSGMVRYADLKIERR